MTRARPMRGSMPWRSEASGEVPYEQPAPRQLVAYTCDRGHRFEVTFAAAATAPDAWDCRCGAAAGLSACEAGPTHRDEHWARVLQRRTVAELEELLAERLAAIHAASQG